MAVMIDAGRFTVLALTDAVNPVTVGLVMQALVAHRSRRPAIVFAAVTYAVNVVGAALVLIGLDALAGVRQAWWLQALIAVTGVAILIGGVRQYVRVRRCGEIAAGKRPGVTGGMRQLVLVALGVNVALLPFAGQVFAAMTMLSDAKLSVVELVLGILGYNLIYTAPLWVVIACAGLKLPLVRLPVRMRPYLSPVLQILVGVALIVLAVLN